MKKLHAQLSILFIFVCFFNNGLTASDYNLKLIKKFYSMGTATINGTYHPLGSSIAKLLSANMENRVIIAEITPGSLANIGYLRQKQIDIALVQSDIVYRSYYGQLGEKFRELRVLASLYSEMIQIIVLADSNIKTIYDLKGCKVAVGELDSGSIANAEAVFAAANIGHNDYLPVYEPITKTTNLLLDGYIDAVCYSGGIPADGIERLADEAEIRFLQIPVEVSQKLIKESPYFTNESIPANSYNKQKYDISTIGFRALLVTTESLPDSEAFKIIETIYENTKEITDKSNLTIKIKLDEALKGVEPDMLHDGVKAFYKMRQVLPQANIPNSNSKLR